MVNGQVVEVNVTQEMIDESLKECSLPVGERILCQACVLGRAVTEAVGMPSQVYLAWGAVWEDKIDTLKPYKYSFQLPAEAVAMRELFDRQLEGKNKGDVLRPMKFNITLSAY